MYIAINNSLTFAVQNLIFIISALLYLRYLLVKYSCKNNILWYCIRQIGRYKRVLAVLPISVHRDNHCCTGRHFYGMVNACRGA